MFFKYNNMYNHDLPKANRAEILGGKSSTVK